MQRNRSNFRKFSFAGNRAGICGRKKLCRIFPAFFVLVSVLCVWAACGLRRPPYLPETGENVNADAWEYGAGGDAAPGAGSLLSGDKGQPPQAAQRSLVEEGREQMLPPLIQTTTLEEDYRAAAELGLMVTPLLSGEDFSQAFENVLCSCVCIQTAEYHGSGSIYRMEEDEIIIVSNRHLLQYWDEESFVIFKNGAAAPGEVIGLSERADLGFVRVQTRHFPWQELLGFCGVRPVGDGSGGEGKVLAEPGERKYGGEREGTGILLVDMTQDPYYPVMKRGEMISASFYLEDFGMEMLCATGQALPGMSGSGVFDGYGNYLGMLTAGTLEGEIAAVPGQVIREEYDSLSFSNTGAAVKRKEDR